MTAAIVKIVGEWWNYPDGVFRRVERGIYPECLVDNVPVLVLMEGAPSPIPATTIENALRSFRSAVVGSGIVVIARYEGGDGWLRVDNSHAKGQREAAAMAAAAMKAAWGWDESERIRIEDQDGSLVISVERNATGEFFRMHVVDGASR
jgi:hypothetical protein